MGHVGMPGGRLRVISYMAPGLPAPLFESLVEHLSDQLATEVDLEFVTRLNEERGSGA